MTVQWYFASDQARFGPFTAAQLQELATQGRILPTDTVWRDGTERGVPAAKVKHLFAPLPADVVPAGIRLKPEVEDTGRAALASPAPVEAPEPSTLAAPATKPPVKRVMKGRAVGVKGAVILSVHGESVRYRKQCTTCNHLDACTNMVPLRNGVTRSSFFCPKCRKAREVLVQGIVYYVMA